MNQPSSQTADAASVSHASRSLSSGGLFLYGLLGAGGVLLEGIVPVFADRILLGGVTALVMAGGTTLISE